MFPSLLQVQYSQFSCAKGRAQIHVRPAVIEYTDSGDGFRYDGLVSSRQHAGPGPTSPAIPEPSLAERARTLASLGRIGSLSTHSRKFPGFPFGSMMPYAVDQHGRPVFSSAAWQCTRRTCAMTRGPACSLRSRTFLVTPLAPPA